MIKNPEQIKGRKKSGRTTKNNDELFARRVEVTKLYAHGMSVSAIARKFELVRHVIETDLKEYEKWTSALEKGGVDTEKITLRAIRKIALDAARLANNPAGKAGLLGKAIEATKEIAILRGARDVDGSNKTFIGGNLEELTKRFQKAGKK